MTQEQTTLIPASSSDSLTGYVSDVEGQPPIQRLIAGMMLKFSNAGVWTDRNNDPIPEDLELILLSIKRYMQYWLPSRQLDYAKCFEVVPGKPWPDLDEYNNREPKEMWHLDLNKKLVGPYTRVNYVYLVNAKTLADYTWPSATKGSFAAIEEICKLTERWRMVRGENVYPRIKLRSRMMDFKQFGKRLWPVLEPQEFIKFGSQRQPPALEAPSKPAAISAPNLETVPEPTLREELNDDIPF
jgi:hypothetical protein